MMVAGHVEDAGAWLRISASIFLPIRLGAIQVLEPLPLQILIVELLAHDPEQLQVPVPVEVPSRQPVKVPMIEQQQEFVEVPQVEVVDVIVLDPVHLQTQVRALESVIKLLGAGGDVDGALRQPLRLQLAALKKAKNDL